MSLVLVLALALCSVTAFAGSKEDTIVDIIDAKLNGAGYDEDDYVFIYLDDMGIFAMHIMMDNAKDIKMTQDFMDSLYTMYDNTLGYVTAFGDYKAVVTLGRNSTEVIYLVFEYEGFACIFDYTTEQPIDIRTISAYQGL